MVDLLQTYSISENKYSITTFPIHCKQFYISISSIFLNLKVIWDIGGVLSCQSLLLSVKLKLLLHSFRFIKNNIYKFQHFMTTISDYTIY